MRIASRSQHLPQYAAFIIDFVTNLQGGPRTNLLASLLLPEVVPSDVRRVGLV